MMLRHPGSWHCGAEFKEVGEAGKSHPSFSDVGRLPEEEHKEKHWLHRMDPGPSAHSRGQED